MNDSIKHEPNHHKSLSEMTDDQIVALVAQIRQRREQPVRIFTEAQALAKQVTDERLREKLTRKLETFGKALEAFDKHAAKMEKLSSEIRAIRLEIEG